MSILKKQEGHVVIHSLANPTFDCYFHSDGDVTINFRNIVEVWNQKEVDVHLIDLIKLVEFAKQFVANNAPI